MLALPLPCSLPCLFQNVCLCLCQIHLYLWRCSWRVWEELQGPRAVNGGWSEKIVSGGFKSNGGCWERERIRLVSAPVQRWSPSGKGRSVYGEFRCQHVECWAQQQVEIELLESTKSLLLGGQACYWDLLLLALRYSTAAVSSAAMIQAQCQGGDGPVGDRVCCRSSTLREKEFEFVESRNVFFSPALPSEHGAWSVNSRDMRKQKRGETGITCRSHSPA